MAAISRTSGCRDLCELGRGLYDVTSDSAHNLNNRPSQSGPGALKILFHETSHGMVDKVRDAISVAEARFNSRQPSKVFHSGSIWHAVLFHRAGELVREQIAGYIPYAREE